MSTASASAPAATGQRHGPARCGVAVRYRTIVRSDPDEGDRLRPAGGRDHFVERQALLDFLDAMITAPYLEEALRSRLEQAEPPPCPRPLRVALPADLRHAMMPDLPANITLEPGCIEVREDSAAAMLECLVTLAMVMQNDLDRFQNAIEPPQTSAGDDELRSVLERMREMLGQCRRSFKVKRLKRLH